MHAAYLNPLKSVGKKPNSVFCKMQKASRLFGSLTKNEQGSIGLDRKRIFFKMEIPELITTHAQVNRSINYMWWPLGHLIMMVLCGKN